MSRTVVTGLGMVTALGADVPTAWRRLLAGDNGITRITYFDPSAYSCKVAAEVRYLPPEETGVSSIPSQFCRRGVQIFLKAVREAHRDAGLDSRPVSPQSIGIAAGGSVNYVNMSLIRCYYRFRNGSGLDMRRLRSAAAQPANSFFRRMGDLMAALPAKALGIAGPTFTLDTACAASSHSIGQAFRLVQRGQVQAMIAGGGCSIVSPIGILAFSLLGALSRNPDPGKASRPFDRCRDGFVMGEGAGAVVLESLESAVARGARIYAELVGFGSTVNAHNMTDPSPDGVCEERAMRLALEEAQLEPAAIDYIAAHGTSTPKNDAAETRAIKRLFGDRARRLLVSSNKGQIGHTISAAGVCNFICAVKAIDEGQVPPTMHYENPDPECDLDYVPNRSREASVRAAMINAFAFGGQNAVLVVRACAS